MQGKEKRDVLGKNIHILIQVVKEPKGSREKRHQSKIKSADFICVDKLEEKKSDVKS